MQYKLINYYIIIIIIIIIHNDRQTDKKTETLLTFSVPVQMCHITWAAFTDSHSLAAQHIVNVHKVVMRSNGQIFSLT